MRWLALALLAVTPAFAGYSYQRPITISHAKVGSGGLTNFPVAVSGTYSYLATAAHGGLVQNANGYDIVFTSDAAGTVLLSYERDTYNAATGGVTFWVNIPALSAAADTTIYLWYGNAAITTDQSNKTAVWDASTLAVYHFGNGTALSNSDSTSHALTTTNTGSPTATASGLLGGGMALNGSSGMLTPTFSISTNSTTWSGWIYPTTNGNAPTLIGQDNTGAGRELVLRLRGSTGYAELNWGYNQCNAGGTTDQWTSTALSLNTWHYLAASVADTSGTTGIPTSVAVALYVDGASVLTWTNNNCSPDTVTQLGIGYELNNANYFTGTLDEVHLASSARSAAWIATEYNNQSSPSTFYTVGPQAVISSALLPANTPLEL